MADIRDTKVARTEGGYIVILPDGTTKTIASAKSACYVLVLEFANGTYQALDFSSSFEAEDKRTLIERRTNRRYDAVVDTFVTGVGPADVWG